MKRLKRFLCMLLTLAMLCAVLPGMAAEVSAVPLPGGSCGEGLSWSFNPASGLLAITGEGYMEDYDPSTGKNPPWSAYSGAVTALSLPDGIHYIGSYAFRSCTALATANFPASLETIGGYSFMGCSKLQTVTLKKGLNFIGYSAFAGCTALRSLTLPAGVSIFGSAFQNCSSLSSVTIPKGTLYVDSYVFDGCTGLVSVNLPDSVEELCYGAFSNCTSLQSLKFPKNLKSIGPFAFYACSALRSVSFPNGLEYIGNCAFAGCESLSSVTLPKSVKRLGHSVFRDCLWLRELVIRNPACQVCCGIRTEIMTPGGGWTVLQYEDFGEPLGDPLGTIVYCPHDAEKEDADPMEVVRFEDENRCTDVYRYVENCAREWWYRYYALDKFSDVPEGKYYEIPVAWAVGNKITSGTGGGRFSPNKECTREQVVTFLWKAEGCPEPHSTENPFTDVKSDKYYYKPILWAVENKITGGAGGGKFGVGKPCTRAQVVTFLWKSVGSQEPDSTENPFTDVPSDKYYYQAVLWAVENGITSGTSSSAFSPNKTCTRAQVVTFLYNLKIKCAY